MRLKTSLSLAAAFLAFAAPATAHRGWLLPSATIFSGSEDWVTVDAAASNDLFFPDHRPASTDNIKVWAPDGTEGKIENAATGRVRSTFDVQLNKPGTWKIGTVQSGVSGSFKADGVEYRLGGRRGPGGPGGPGGQGAGGEGPRSVNSVDEIPANATDINITESGSRNEIFVTAGEPTETVYQPSGKGLEMVPVTHPAELVQGEPARFRFLVDGQPVPALKVTIVPGGKRYRDGDGAMEVTTGADGVATVDFPEAGMFWLNTSHSDNKPSIAKATARRLSYTTTLEVMAP